MRAVSLFSGCGGFDLGLSRNGVEIIWANDIDEAAARAYRHFFPKTEFIHGDIIKIDKIPQADILIGCYPCTGFSQAARRKWKNREERNLKNNPKNFLFQEFLRAIKIVRPKVIFIENVQGMLSASKGEFFKDQINGLKELGFSQVYHKLLNSAEYGVAQTRKRVFLVGIHDSLGKIKYEFPSSTHGQGIAPLVTMKDVIGHLPLNPKGEYSEQVFHGHYLTRNRKRSWNEPSYTIVASADHVVLHPSGEPMKKVGKDHWVLQGNLNRRLSYRECFAIQGLPSNIDYDDTMQNKYKVAGNAVPPKLAEVVSKEVLNFLE